MKRCLVAGLLLVSVAAWAGEALIGTIASIDGGTASNRCTTVPFGLSGNAKITVQCSAAAAIGVNVSGCDGGVCLSVPAETMLSTSTNGQVTLSCAKTPLADAGFTPATYYGGWVAVAPMVAAPMTCKVFSRNGSEH